MGADFTRRTFCLTALAATAARGQSSRIDVAAAERDHVLSEAAAALKQPITPITQFPVAGKSLHSFYSEAGPLDSSKPFRAHANALQQTSAAISALTAAFVLTQEPQYALRAGNHLYAWFVDPTTAMLSSLEGAYGNADTALSKAPGILDAASLAEIARSLQFLTDTAALSPPDLTTAKAWFTSLLEWLTTDRVALIARDMRDHTASAWLLMASAFARLLGDSTQLATLRHRFKQPTLRNQIQATGIFHHEIITTAPWRNALLNFDLLTGACELLSTPFVSLWPYELEDGPGMRAVAAFLFPYLKSPSRWPYPADDFRFREVPLRRPGLLFAGRAYTRPEYVELWKSLPYISSTDPLASTLPIRQPVLWTTRVPHENLV